MPYSPLPLLNKIDGQQMADGKQRNGMPSTVYRLLILPVNYD